MPPSKLEYGVWFGQAELKLFKFNLKVGESARIQTKICPLQLAN